MPNGLSLPTYEADLQRIEVSRGTKDETLQWTVNLHAITPDKYIAAGILRRSRNGLDGQALCLARIDDLDTSIWSNEVVRRWLIGGPIELMYDICRRSLESQASYMDTSLDLPKKAPAAGFDIPAAPSVDEMQAMQLKLRHGTRS